MINVFVAAHSKAGWNMLFHVFCAKSWKGSCTKGTLHPPTISPVCLFQNNEPVPQVLKQVVNLSCLSLYSNDGRGFYSQKKTLYFFIIELERYNSLQLFELIEIFCHILNAIVGYRVIDN